MSKSRRIFKKLFWWLSKSKSRGSSSPKERTSSRETITTGEKEEEKLVIKTNPPVEQPQLKEEEKPVININPPIEEPLEPLNPTTRTKIINTTTTQPIKVKNSLNYQLLLPLITPHNSLFNRDFTIFYRPIW